MPWTVTDPILERARLIAVHSDVLYSVAEFAACAGVSRKTACKSGRSAADAAERVIWAK